jgi:DNA modification methylase
MVERLLESSSDPGDLVVDPFCGSGTTGEASAKVGRRCVLGDIDPKMVRVSCLRLGVSVPDGVEEEYSESIPECPIFNVVPPDPCLWGVHPEDLAHSMGKGR